MLKLTLFLFIFPYQCVRHINVLWLLQDQYSSWLKRLLHIQDNVQPLGSSTDFFNTLFYTSRVMLWKSAFNCKEINWCHLFPLLLSRQMLINLSILFTAHTQLTQKELRGAKLYLNNTEHSKRQNLKGCLCVNICRLQIKHSPFCCTNSS